jgi:hypothetical protein
METRFRDARLKIGRARAHIADIEAWLRDVNQSNSDIARTHKEAAAGSNAETLWIKRPASFLLSPALVAGDAIHNLRAALDIIAWTIVYAGGKDDPNSSSFPLYEENALRSSPQYRLIATAIPEIAPIIFNFVRDYKADDSCLLWALNQLDRIDKHRLLIHTLTQSSSRMIAIRKEHENDPPPAEPGAIYSIPQEVIDGVPEMKQELTPGSKAYLHNQVNGYPTVDIRFGKGEILDSQPIIPTLHQLAEVVTKLVDELDARILSLEADGLI